MAVMAASFSLEVDGEVQYIGNNSAPPVETIECIFEGDRVTITERLIDEIEEALAMPNPNGRTVESKDTILAFLRRHLGKAHPPKLSDSNARP